MKRKKTWTTLDETLHQRIGLPPQVGHMRLREDLVDFEKLAKAM